MAVGLSALSVFIPTFFLVSLTPGLCMTLSMSLGMTVGVRRALWMMVGELVGVGTTAVLAAVGVAAVMLHYPSVFEVFKWIGGAYLVYVGVTLWRAETVTGASDASQTGVRPSALVSQGFVTAIANPKGWAFDISLLPPFLDRSQALVPQLVELVAILLVIEFVCLMLYATGGQTAQRLIRRGDNVRTLNQIAGTLIIGVGGWLALG